MLECVADTVFPSDSQHDDAAVGALIGRLQAYLPETSCIGAFWLSEDFLSLDGTLLPEEIHEAMLIAEKRHDCNYGYNWDYLQSCIDEIRKS